ncbi:tetratricopeptide repeat protein [Lactococcus petauri]|uniref:tetratricopeptide repeat protein n=1 Tax=Lactococcus petauri TaxID=1940789 RepID=UPI00385311C0
MKNKTTLNTIKDTQNDNDYINLGNLYRQQKKLKEAELNYEKAIEINPQNDKAYFYLGFLYQQQKKIDKAELNYKKAIESNPQNDIAYFYLGNLYRQQKKLKEAELNYKKAIEINPQNDKAYFYLGFLYQQQKKIDKAELNYKKAIESNPQNDIAYFYLGNLHRQQKKLKEAELNYKKAIEINPQNDKAYFYLGFLYQQQKKIDKAELNYKKAIESNPQNANAYFYLGFLYQQQKKIDKAELNYKKDIEINPQNDKAYNNLGFLYQQQKKLKEAELNYKKAIEINPQNDKSYNNLGNLYRQQEKLKEAELNYKKAIEVNPQNDNAYNNLGNLYRQQEKLKEAEFNYKKAIEIKDSPLYNNNLSKINEMQDLHIQSLNSALDNLGKYTVDFDTLILNKIEPSHYKMLFDSTKHYNSEVSEVIGKIETNNLDQVNGLYISLIKLMVEVNNFKYNLLVTDNTKLGIAYQYTSIDTLKSMLNLNTCCESTNIKIRLYNTDYMNDPDEGEFFINQLKRRGCTELLDAKYSVSHAFISSLTSEKDSIPMWSMYGQNSNGISLGFSNYPVTPSLEDSSGEDSSGIQEAPDDMPLSDDLDLIARKLSKYPYIEEKAKVYEVSYIDPENDSKLLEFEKIITSISQELNKDIDVKNILYDSISKFISVELDRIKFLIKNDKYSYEKEYRILQMVKDLSLGKSQIKYDSNNPKLYLEVEDINIEEVIFGVDSDNYTLWRPILEMKIPNIDIKKISKSSVPLRYK